MVMFGTRYHSLFSFLPLFFRFAVVVRESVEYIYDDKNLRSVDNERSGLPADDVSTNWRTIMFMNFLREPTYFHQALNLN